LIKFAYKSLVLLILSLSTSQVLFANGDYQTASLYFNEEEYEDASAEFKKILDNADEKIEIKGKAGFYFAECLFRLKKYKESRDAFVLYLKNYKEDLKRPEGQYRISECFYFLENFKKAALGYERFIKENSQHELLADALYSLGGSYLETGEFKLALKAYQNLVKTFPAHKYVEPAEYYIGWVYYRGDDYENAGKTFQQFFEKYTSSKYAIEALLRSADALFRVKEYRPALENYNKVLRNGQGAYEKEAKQGIAWAYYKLKEYGKASSYFLTIARDEKSISPKAEAYYQAIQSYFSGEDFVNGLKVSSELGEKCKGHDLVGDSYYWRGFFYKRLGKLAEAEKSFKSSLGSKRLKVSKEEVIVELGAVLITQKKSKEAVNLYQSVLNKKGKGDIVNQIRYDLSRALFDSGDTDGAIVVAKKVNSEKGSLAQVSKFSLAEYYFANKEYTKAMPLYRVVSKNPPNKNLKRNADYRLGWSNKLINKPEEAIKIFKSMDLSFEKKYSREMTYLVAGMYMDLEDLENAQIWYSKLINRVGSFSADSFLALGNHKYDQNKFKEVVELMYTFIRVLPNNILKAEALFLLAEASYELNDSAQAIDSYTKIINGGKSAVIENALYGRAWIFYEKNDQQKSISDLDRLLKDFPKTAFKSSAIQLKGKIFMASNQLDKAVEEFRKGLSVSGESEVGEIMLMNLANAEAERREYFKALKLYDEFQEKFSQSKRMQRVVYEKGWILMQMGNSSDAELVFSTYKRKYPKGKYISDVEFALGEISYDKKDYASAFKYYKNCGDQHKDKALYKSGWCKFKLKKYKDAAVSFKTLVDQCPDSAVRLESIYRAGLSFMMAESYSQASVLLEKYYKVGRGDRYYAEALYKLGKIYEKTEKVSEAKDKYEVYLKLFPKGDLRQEVELRMGKIYLSINEYVRAREYLESILKDKTHYLSIEAQYDLAESYFRDAQYKEANPEYLKTLLYKDGKKWQAASLLKIGMGYQALKNDEKAKKYYNKLIERFPSFEESKKAVEILQGM